ncbi:hypothetical protein [Sphingomonas trueperi]|uniref:hypothetical protein n=1 Tax=Sphingomonas trueperi TaxID=53317 RepID=UPI0011C42D8F
MDDVPALNPTLLRDQLMERLRAIDAQIENLHRERDALRSDLAVTDQFLAVWRRTNNVQGPPERADTTILPICRDVPIPPRKPRNPPRDYVVTEALKIIQERGKPVPRGELYEALRERGVEVFGKDPVMVLSTMLWRSVDRIVRLKDHGYWPKDEAYEPASYYPDLDEVIDVADREPEDGQIEEPDYEAEVTLRKD